VKPYRALFARYRDDIRSAIKSRGGNLNTGRREMKEVSDVMDYLEGVCKQDEAIQDLYEELIDTYMLGAEDYLVASVWRLCWARILEVLEIQFQETGAKRKHDMSRCTLRTINKRLCQ